MRTVAIACLLAVLCAPSVAHADLLEKPAASIELANALSELGLAKDDKSKVNRAVALYKEAREKLESPELDPATMSEGMRSRRGAMLETIRSRLAMCERYLKHANRGPPLAPEGEQPKAPAEPPKPPMKPLPDRVPGQLAEVWIRKAIAQFKATEDPNALAIYAAQIMQEGGVHALPAMFELFEAQQLPPVRAAIHEALAAHGTLRVATQLRTYASKRCEAHWHHALDVIYRCLRKPDKVEKERPFQRAVRAFYALKDRSLTVGMISELDRMGKEGVAALGQVVYVPDYGYHDHVIGLLGGKRDSRAVPPLVYKMNRFKFEHRVQMPAHRALMELGWYAAEELINRLDDKAAGIWISWTLRKISGETMGTDKRKWHDWWKSEKKRHPELFDEPDERPGPTTPK